LTREQIRRLPRLPGLSPSPPPDREKISEGSVDLRLKDEVNEAAMRFIKEMPNVKHAKTCYSKLYGPCISLFTAKRKRFQCRQYSWNDKSKEWEVTGPPFEVPASSLITNSREKWPMKNAFA